MKVGIFDYEAFGGRRRIEFTIRANEDCLRQRCYVTFLVESQYRGELYLVTRAQPMLLDQWKTCGNQTWTKLEIGIRSNSPG